MSAVASDAVAWIERSGAPHANDAMVMERLAISLSITTARRAADSTGSVDLAVSEHTSDEERGTALTRLRLNTEQRLRAIALPHDGEEPAGEASSIVFTPRGLARAVIARPGQTVDAVGRMGSGRLLERERLAESWATALIALRLTTPTVPRVDADDLGALLILAETADQQHSSHPDVVALDALDARSLELLDALVESDSVRAAAVRLGRHHSTVQERASALATTLGYDPRTALGRTRYQVARMLLRLAQPGL
jgi:hypothetical protein